MFDAMGHGNMIDAMHATAAFGKADGFLTCDERLVELRDYVRSDMGRPGPIPHHLEVKQCESKHLAFRLETMTETNKPKVWPLADFGRAYFGDQLLRNQPDNDSTAWNRLEYRPLEGFAFAVSPFNFTCIAGNVPTAPMLMGDTVDSWRQMERTSTGREAETAAGLAESQG